MTEQKLLKKQLIKNMLLNLIAFSIIFSILGGTIYIQVENSLYKSSDEELMNMRNRTGIIEKLDGKVNVNKMPKNTSEEMPENNNMKQGLSINPRLVYIVRDVEGNISEESANSESLTNIVFDKENLNKIYSTTLNGEYKYRGINYETTNNNEKIYIQILINIDAEEAIMENFQITLIASIIISILMSIFASYVLSKKTMKPILESWKKQTEFVQNASHELRTPLTIIQAKQELLLEEPNSKIIDQAEEITTTLNETRRLSKLVKDLMDLARSDSNKNKLNKTKTNIDNLIKNISEPFAEMAKAQKKKLDLKLNYNKEIELDINKIHQLFVIILDNAIKYTEKGDTITIETNEKDGKLILDIKDTGIGISDEGIKHIFERFYREDKARSRETGGSGLGLSIASSIVEEHGGTIKAMHNNPKGTIIEIKMK